eukprot:CAMPEP_0178606596 /NCGR_PEP_ID=MMETSP0697-20121206/37164_1 /TAXON_ID=265572 /ORGANISM="Extubocellulus spinifer, Strain CCMP396" /LENGTH=46 /DNA_ID= /DNA_START= /DNA_END= /DNA_ORIENTATION=
MQHTSRTSDASHQPPTEQNQTALLDPVLIGASTEALSAIVLTQTGP